MSITPAPHPSMQDDPSVNRVHRAREGSSSSCGVCHVLPPLGQNNHYCLFRNARLIATLILSSFTLFTEGDRSSGPEIIAHSTGMILLLFSVSVPPITGNFIISCVVDGTAFIFRNPGLPMIPLNGDVDLTTMKSIHADVSIKAVLVSISNDDPPSIQHGGALGVLQPTASIISGPFFSRHRSSGTGMIFRCPAPNYGRQFIRTLSHVLKIVPQMVSFICMFPTFPWNSSQNLCLAFPLFNRVVIGGGVLNFLFLTPEFPSEFRE
ncbi:hypothetical protein Tco_0556370 [Tanacetum coccineum]